MSAAILGRRSFDRPSQILEDFRGSDQEAREVLIDLVSYGSCFSVRNLSTKGILEAEKALLLSTADDPSCPSDERYLAWLLLYDLEGINLTTSRIAHELGGHAEIQIQKILTADFHRLGMKITGLEQWILQRTLPRTDTAPHGWFDRANRWVADRTTPKQKRPAA